MESSRADPWPGLAPSWRLSSLHLRPDGRVAQDGPRLDRSESVIANLRSKDVEVRRNAATRLRNSGRDVQRQALPILIDLLMKEKDGQVRLAVLDVGHRTGPGRKVGGPRAGSHASHRLRRPEAGRAAPGLSFRPGAGGHRQARGRGPARLVEGAEGIGASRGRHGPGPDRPGRRSRRPRPDPAARRQERTDRAGSRRGRSARSARPRSCP